MLFKAVQCSMRVTSLHAAPLLGMAMGFFCGLQSTFVGQLAPAQQFSVKYSTRPVIVEKLTAWISERSFGAATVSPAPISSFQ